MGRRGCQRALFVVVLLFLAIGPAGGKARAAGGELEEQRVLSLGSVVAGSDEILLSPTGNRMACVEGRPGEKQTVHVDGEAGQTYDYIAKVAFSPDGKHLGHTARQGVKWLFILDGKEFANVGTWQASFAFSPDGRHMAYCLMKNGMHLFVDGKPEGGGGASEPVFSPDGKHFAHLADHGKRVVLDRKGGPRYDKVNPPVFAPNSRSVAYAACNDNDWFVGWRKKKFGKYEEVGQLVFSPDSRHIAYRAMVDKTWRVFRDGKAGAVFAEVGEPVFSRDGKRLAYRARTDDGWCIVLDGKPGESYQDVGQPVFSPDSKLLAFPAKKDGKPVLVCNDETCESAGDIKWAGFCPKGKHLVMVVEEGGGMRLVCDGMKGPRHARIIVPKRCHAAAGKFRFAVIDGAEAFLTEIDWPAKSGWKDLFAAP